MRLECPYFYWKPYKKFYHNLLYLSLIAKTIYQEKQGGFIRSQFPFLNLRRGLLELQKLTSKMYQMRYINATVPYKYKHKIYLSYLGNVIPQIKKKLKNHCVEIGNCSQFSSSIPFPFQVTWVKITTKFRIVKFEKRHHS